LLVDMDGVLVRIDVTIVPTDVRRPLHALKGSEGRRPGP
jgi:hypothetical protein